MKKLKFHLLLLCVVAVSTVTYAQEKRYAIGNTGLESRRMGGDAKLYVWGTACHYHQLLTKPLFYN